MIYNLLLFVLSYVVDLPGYIKIQKNVMLFIFNKFILFPYDKFIIFKAFLVTFYSNYYLPLNWLLKVFIQLFFFTASAYTFYHFGGIDFFIHIGRKLGIALNLIHVETSAPPVPMSTQWDWLCRRPGAYPMHCVAKIMLDPYNEKLYHLEYFIKPIAPDPKYFEHAWREGDTLARQVIADALANKLAKEQFDKNFWISLYKIAFIAGCTLTIIAKIYSNTP